jgi:hypothetical protein
MPLLEAGYVQGMIEDARSTRHRRDCAECHARVARDYCRSCDEFYWIHAPGCSMYDDHFGHRLTIVPFVEMTLRDRLMNVFMEER